MGTRDVLPGKNSEPTTPARIATYIHPQGGSNPAIDDSNTNTAVDPLYGLSFPQWWMQANRGCNLVPPKGKLSLELPAGGSFKVEIAHNRRQTSLSYNGAYASDWPDGQNHSADWRGPGNPPNCLANNPDGQGGALHTRSEATAAGTAFAISYESDLRKVTMQNLVVFSTLPK
jgi:hypothetical protein